MAVTLSPTALPEGAVDEEYSVQLEASGGEAPYTFAVTTGTLPDGVTLTSGGLLSGYPDAAATTAFTVTATDSTPTTHQTGTQSYSLVVVVAEVADIHCPSYMCADAGRIQMIDLGNGDYLCPRCEQQSTVVNGVATLKPGYHA